MDTSLPEVAQQEQRLPLGWAGIAVAMAAYGAAWIGLFAVSTNYWFLPAGLRLAVLWWLPRRRWPLMALAEWGAILGLSLWRGAFSLPASLLVTTLLPWCLYALVIAKARKLDAGGAVLDGLGWMLGAGVIAATSTAGMLAWVDSLERPVAVSELVFAYVLGDFIGILIVAPLAVAALQALDSPQPFLARLLQGMRQNLVVVMPAVLALSLALLRIPQASLFALVLALAALFWIASQRGWQCGAVALGLLSIVVYALDDRLFRVWTPVQLQLLIASAGAGALLFGASQESLRESVGELDARGKRLADVAQRLVRSQEDERRRIGMDLHDQIGQDITAIATHVSLAQRESTDADAQRSMSVIANLVRDTHTHLREVIDQLQPSTLDRFGLEATLRDGPFAGIVGASGIAYRCQIAGDVSRIPEALALAIYRICQEAVTNAARHHGGSSLSIHLTVDEHADSLHLTIRDDAGRIDLGDGAQGSGLRNIRDRADAVGAVYRFDPESGEPRHALQASLQPLPTPLAG